MNKENITSWLNLEAWNYSDFFPRLPEIPMHPIIDDVEAYIFEIKLDKHPFFLEASRSRHALQLWVTQELVMTNAFSQIVLSSAARIKNVHMRSILSEVAFGEHGAVRRGLAKRAHPWLLNGLRESTQIDPSDVYPIEATLQFITGLAKNSENQLRAVAYIGVGNERMIIPEYSAIKSCFMSVWPECQYEPFLKANLDADVEHSRLCYELANWMIHFGESAQDYFDAAKSSIDARYSYFDGLLDYLNKTQN